MKTSPWIQTYSGIPFDLENPTAKMVRVIDIIHALPHINRFNGHSTIPYSVAQHSVLMCDRFDMNTPKRHDLAMWALFHDAHKAYTGDVAAPIKWAVPEIEIWEEKIAKVVRGALGLVGEIPDPVKLADLRMLVTETRALMCPPPKPWGLDVDPYHGLEIIPWGSGVARKEFAKRIQMVVNYTVIHGKSK